MGNIRATARAEARLQENGGPIVRWITIALALLVGLLSPAWADNAAEVRARAEQGDAQAQYALGSLYRYGQGVPQDYDAALRWWRKSAELGLTDAQFALGNIYAGNAGIARDNLQAYMWYDIAARQTREAWLREIAASNRDALAMRMSAADIAEARHLAAAWTAKRGK